MKIKLKKGDLAISFLLFVIIITAMDLLRISEYKVIPKDPAEKIETGQDQLYFDLVKGAVEIDWSRLDGTLRFISGEYDCSDFRFVNLIRILYQYGDQIPKEYLSKMENVIFNFRYWWDEPGENSMCYWSENHQILFASAEYLTSQRYPSAVFGNSGLTGKQHMEKAKKRILDWLEMRWKYGFSEFYSGVYYKEDIGALINLIDFAQDKEIVHKSQIIMDLIFYDVASQNLNAMFVSVSGRAYEWNRKGGAVTLGGLTNYLWGNGKKIGAGMLYGMMTTKNYMLPPVIAEIGRDTSEVVIKQSNGLDITELKSEGYFGTDNRSMMMQWGMEAFTNPEVVRNSLKNIRNCNMFSNEFISDFKMMDFSMVKWLHLEPVIIKIINPQSNGAAIQKGNTYTYKTKDYSMYTVQAYHPGSYGDQQHVFGMNMGSHFSIFHNHPALEKGVKYQSPNYWVGYGHIPHSVQDENINLSIYNIPEKKGLMEIDLLDYTHAWFPSTKFDTAFIAGNYVFGKKGDTYCVFIGANGFEYRDDKKDDIIQKGKKSFWITEAGSEGQDGSFSQFVERIKNNNVSFQGESQELTYQSNGKTLQLKFGGEFKLDGKIVNTNYSRYDSPYVKAEKKDSTLKFEFNGKFLFLDFYNLKREFLPNP